MTRDSVPLPLETDRKTSRKLTALTGLFPFILPYRGLIAAAMFALMLTAAVSLVLPLAVRRVVDNFNMNKRFIIVGVALGIIVVLAVIIGSPAIGGFDAMR